MLECIRRDAAINAIKSLESSMPAKDNYAKGYDAALGRALIAVREVPLVTDVQPVVHAHWVSQVYCKDCKYAQNPNDTMIYCTYFECGTLSQNDFCSQAQRRVENG